MSNFFTYFQLLEDPGDPIEIEALTLFFNEKFFGSVKLAIISFNNLLINFEDEYKDYYLENPNPYSFFRLVFLANRVRSDIDAYP